MQIITPFLPTDYFRPKMFPYPFISIQHHFLKVDVLVWMCSIAHKLVCCWSPAGEAVLEGSRTLRRYSLTGGSRSLGGSLKGYSTVPLPIFSLLPGCGCPVTKQPSAPTSIPSRPAAMFPPDWWTVSLPNSKSKEVLSPLSSHCQGIS